VHLSPKAFELLKLLIECRPRALPKAELLDRVWPGVFVSDASLARVINELRQAVGDHAHGSLVIRTCHGHGYAFVADIDSGEPTFGRTQPGSAVACWLESHERDFALREGEQVAGRDPSLPLWLDSARVSRRHAKVSVAGTSAMIQDLGSKNGTFVRDRRITGPTPLAPGDTIRIGPFTFVFRAYEPTGQTETEVFTRAPE
jgi:hypothetical protein